MRKEYRNSWLRSPKGRFYQHRCNAQQRGVPFTLTFEEWINLWGDKYEKRGCKEGEYVMCRQGDVGAYEVGNVFIDTAKANIGQVPPHKMISRPVMPVALAFRASYVLYYSHYVSSSAACRFAARASRMSRLSSLSRFG